MKKYLSFLVIMLAFVMQCSILLAEGIHAPVILHYSIKPLCGGTSRPSKSDPNNDPTVSVYLNESADSLLLYSSLEESISYYIYDDDEQELCNGSVTFSEQGEGSIYIGAFGEGSYIIDIVVDDIVYEGYFQL